MAFCQFKKEVLSVKQKPTKKTVKDITVWATVTFHNGPYKLISDSFKEAKITSSTSILGFPGGSVLKNLCLPMQETQVQSLSWEDPLEKEMASHSSILTWEIPGTEEPDGMHEVA